MKNSGIFLSVIALFFCGCTSLRPSETRASDEELYRQAIQHAIYPEPNKVYDKLIPVNKENEGLAWKEIEGEDYLLVVSWKQNVSFYQQYLDSSFYNTGPYPIWVSTSPELWKRIREEAPEDVERRLKQLLGLPPTSQYSYFVEFWVRPADIFRPCPDNEVTDRKCDLCFPDQADSTHVAWINENRISRYYQCELFDQYPWTQLGYTYDWNPKNKSHVGLSEFVIGTGKNIVVKAIYTTDEYIQMNEGE